MRHMKLRASIESQVDPSIKLKTLLSTAVKKLDSLGMPSSAVQRVPKLGTFDDIETCRSLTPDEVRECLEILPKLTTAAAAWEAAKVAYPYWSSYEWGGGDNEVEEADYESFNKLSDYLGQDSYYEKMDLFYIAYGVPSAYKAIVRLLEKSVTSTKPSNEAVLATVATLGLGLVVLGGAVGLAKLAAAGVNASEKWIKKGVSAAFSGMAKREAAAAAEDAEAQSIKRYVERLSALEGRYPKDTTVDVKGAWVADLSVDGKFDPKDPMRSIRQICKYSDQYLKLVDVIGSHSSKVYDIIEGLDKDIMRVWTPSVESMATLESYMATRDLMEQDRLIGLAIEQLETLEVTHGQLLEIRQMMDGNPSVESLGMCIAGMRSIASSYGLTVPSIESHHSASLEADGLIKRTKDAFIALLVKIGAWIKGLFTSGTQDEKVAGDLTDAVEEALEDLEGDMVVNLGLSPRDLISRHQEITRATGNVITLALDAADGPADPKVTTKVSGEADKVIAQYRTDLKGTQKVNKRGIETYAEAALTIAKSTNKLRDSAEKIFTKVTKEAQSTPDDKLPAGGTVVITAARKAVSNYAMINSFTVQLINRSVKAHL